MVAQNKIMTQKIESMEGTYSLNERTSRNLAKQLQDLQHSSMKNDVNLEKLKNENLQLKEEVF